ncbi:glycosyltransferase [Blastococcus mobilis]|uniref:Glycosyltransferase involved in cell wall bisynthesis n=1 Tax=Blastococcus mobilis TaxID=1938746 RepID=A0A239AM90_9ACTN|nr:glycosyltransferase [Blastococcus mobilis]SNR96806.1 Glycosyltransferase involved in cell wall bisynthesis [Blastococcus mobilis]
MRVNTSDRKRVLAWPARRNRAENPYNYLLSQALAAIDVRVDEFEPARAILGKFDVLHIHWPEALIKNVGPGLAGLRLFGLSLILLWVRFLRRKPIVWTVHNVAPHGHQRRGLIFLLRLLLLVVVDRTIYLDRSTSLTLAAESARLAKKPSTVIPHGLYTVPPPDEHFQHSLALKLDTASDVTVFGLVGSLERYKGVSELIGAFMDCEDRSLRLLLVGACRDASLRAEVEEAQAKDDRVRVRLGWLSEKEMVAAIGVSDWIVVPFRNVTNSGSIIMALQVGRPVIVPALGSLPSLADEVGSEWMMCYPSGRLRGALAEARGRPKPATAPRLAARDWHSIAVATRAVYELAIGS